MVSLGREQRVFFEQVAAIATMNPFSEERDVADRNLAGHNLVPRSSHLLEELTRKVSKALLAFKSGCKAAKPLSLLKEDERNLVRKVVLFHEFHASTSGLDEFILEQELEPSLLAPRFAAGLLQRLQSWGFSREDSERYLAMMYQMRRAYLFISRTLSGENERVMQLKASLWNSVFSYDSELFDALLLGKMERFSLLLLGETGTGKSVVARAIGLSQFIPWNSLKGCFVQHPSACFLAVNLSEYPESLLESALFGHKKGAFTGAFSSHVGVFAQSDENTLVFLDEIGEISPSVQVKLLRVLQERQFTPVGDEKPHAFRGRIVAATNRTLDELIEGQRMRLDLFFRLCTDVIELPSMRVLLAENSKEALRLVALIGERTLGKALSNRESSLVKQKIEEVVGVNYSWPGNVRELEQRVRHVLLTGKTTLPPLDKPRQAVDRVGLHQLDELLVTAAESGVDADGLVRRYCAALYAKEKSFEAVARLARLDWRTVRKLCLQEA